MSFPFFVAQRFFRNIDQNRQQASNPTITIATAGVAIGVMVMVISLCVILGFKAEVTKKVEGFGSHIEILDFRSLTAPDGFPINTDTLFVQQLLKIPEIKSVDRVVQKMGIFKTDKDFMSITLKGIPPNYDTTFLAQHLLEGKLPNWEAQQSNEILISRQQADGLHLKVGDRIFTYFFEEGVKMRRFTICGIYQTNMTLFDNNIVFTPYATVSHLNRWSSTQSTLLEIRLHDIQHIERTLPNVQKLCQISPQTQQVTQINAISIKDLYSHIFSWLELLDFNLWIIMALMSVVSGFTMISGLFILILERTSTIGTLKALGSKNKTIRHIFLYLSSLITLRGIIVGNLLALLFVGIQHQWRVIHLDPSTYYVESVPIVIDFWLIFIVNLLSLLLTTLTLIAPSYLISRIQPAKAIRFE